MPAHAVVAEPREELEDWVVGPQLAALREAADGKYVSVEAPCVALVASVLADAGDEGDGDARRARRERERGGEGGELRGVRDARVVPCAAREHGVERQGGRGATQYDHG